MNGTTKWLTTKEAATRLGLSQSTLSLWRTIDYGPPWQKFRRLVRYESSALDSWANSTRERTNSRGSLAPMPLIIGYPVIADVVFWCDECNVAHTQRETNEEYRELDLYAGDIWPVYAEDAACDDASRSRFLETGYVIFCVERRHYDSIFSARVDPANGGSTPFRPATNR